MNKIRGNSELLRIIFAQAADIYGAGTHVVFQPVFYLLSVICQADCLLVSFVFSELQMWLGEKKYSLF